MNVDETRGPTWKETQGREEERRVKKRRENTECVCVFTGASACACVRACSRVRVHVRACVLVQTCLCVERCVCVSVFKGVSVC